MIKLLSLLKEEIDIEMYLLKWLASGGRKVNKNMPHAFVLELGKQGYRKYGTIYRCFFLKKKEIKGMDYSDLKDLIWKRYKGGYISFSSTQGGAEWFAGAMSRNDFEVPIIIKQESEYYDIYQWFEDNKYKMDLSKELKVTGKYYGLDSAIEEVEATHECISTLNKDFKIITKI